MKLITEKAVALVNALEDRNSKLAEVIAQNNKLSAQLEEGIKSTEAKAADLKAREEAIKPIEDIVALNKAAIAMKEEARLTVAEGEARNKSLSSALVERERLVEEGKAKNDADRESLAAGKAALEEERKTFKAKVLAGVQKDLDAAKKKV